MTLALAIMTGAALGLIVLSAFFSGSETALTTSSRPRLHELEKRGDKRARTVLDLKEQPERLIGGILLGNNLVNILASALATTVFLRLFGESGVVWATLVMTALVLVFGEVLPKTYAIVYPERFSLAVAAIISLFVKIFGPIVIGVEVIVEERTVAGRCRSGQCRQHPVTSRRNSRCHRHASQGRGRRQE